MADPVAVCRSLSKVYGSASGRVDALRDVDADFGRNELTAIVGPSGSGKSSLLRILAGLEPASGGTVVAAGLDVTGARGSALRRYRRTVAAYVGQRPIENFLPQLTLAEHVELTGRTRADARAAFAHFGLDQRLSVRPSALSGGEQARAAIALALLRRTTLLLADEPTAELDDISAHRLLDALVAAKSEASVVLATHDRDVIELADRVLRLENGRVVDDAGSVPVARPSAPRRTRPRDAVIEATGLTKVFTGRGSSVAAVVNVELAAAAGRLNVILGRSGSGKSTLLSLLGGWHRPDAGVVRILADGLPVEPSATSWNALAYIPQRFGLVPELTIRENVEHPAFVRGTLAGATARLAALRERLGLSPLDARLPHEVSVGQQQRTAVARALALEPRIVLADEPTSHQDAAWADAVIGAIADACRAGTTAIVATHEPAIARFADDVWEMHDGRLTGG